MPEQQQNQDGQWVSAEPIPYFPGLDWEVTGPDQAGLRTAHLYRGSRLLATVQGRNRLLLGVRMHLAQWLNRG